MCNVGQARIPPSTGLPGPVPVSQPSAGSYRPTELSAGPGAAQGTQFVGARSFHSGGGLLEEKEFQIQNYV